MGVTLMLAASAALAALLLTPLGRRLGLYAPRSDPEKPFIGGVLGVATWRFHAVTAAYFGASAWWTLSAGHRAWGLVNAVVAVLQVVGLVSCLLRGGGGGSPGR